MDNWKPSDGSGQQGCVKMVKGIEQQYGDYLKERGVGEVEESKGGINKWWWKETTWCGEYTIQYTSNVLWNCTPETYAILLTNVTPINLIKNKI